MSTPGGRRVLVATADRLAEQMAGPAIRAWNIAATLAADGHDVVLLGTNGVDIGGEGFRTEAPPDDDAFRAALDWCDVIVLQGWIMVDRPWIAASDKAVVVDLYDPMHLEALEQARDAGDEARRVAVRSTTAVLSDQIRRADLMVCASEQQRTFWLGHLAAVGRVNPRTYDDDPSLRRLLDVVPFGVDAPPPDERGGLRGAVAGVGPDDLVLLWGGGIYNWFDPATLIEAVDRLRGRHPTLRLVFLGGKHPNPDIPQMSAAVAARRLAEERGLAGTHVFFNEGWVPYRERHRMLLDADIGVSTHHDHVETELSFRTRVVDYLWAGLPVVSTGGDALADLVERRGAGLSAPAGDVEALAGALDALLSDPDRRVACARASAAIAEELRWPVVLEPIRAFCRSPRRAPDLLDPVVAAEVQAGPSLPSPPSDVGLAVRYLREGGPRLLVERIRSRLAHRRAGRA